MCWCAPGSTTYIILNLMSTTRPGGAIHEMLLESYNSIVAHLHSSGDGLMPGGIFHRRNSVSGLEIFCVNSNNHQLTWGVLGAALNALEDFMNENQMWSAATFGIYDGPNYVGVGTMS